MAMSEMDEPADQVRSQILASIALVPIVVGIWLAMMLFHEMGHVLAAWATGGQIVSLELRPGWLSHTLVQPNPQPGLVLWSGFLAGWLAPQMTWPLWKIDRGLFGPVLRAWAGFCLLAGGVYLAVGGGEKLADTGQLVACGWPLAALIVSGTVVAAIGYWRSRSAWIAIAQTISKHGATWQVAAGWCAGVAAWWGGQHALATALTTP